MTIKSLFRGFLFTSILLGVNGLTKSQINLLTNPGMESWSGGIPSHWDKTGTTYITEEHTIKYGGNASARFEVPTTSTVVELNQDVSITAGAVYTFKCWVHDNTVQGEVGLLINWRNAGGSLSTETSSRSTDTGGWQQLSIPSRQAPLTANVARVRIKGYKQDGAGGGYVYIDDTLFYDDVSLPVTLSSFSAIIKNGVIVIKWSTESEAEIVGFHILRSAFEGESFERITTALIPSRGSGSMGSAYEFVDRNVEKGSAYWYKIEQLRVNGQIQMLGPVYAVRETENRIPNKHKLFFNYPNPFNPSTTIRYHVSENEETQRTSLRIYSMLGREIMTLVDWIHEAGEYSVDWNGCDPMGIEVPNGIYFYRLLSGGRAVETKKMIKMN